MTGARPVDDGGLDGTQNARWPRPATLPLEIPRSRSSNGGKRDAADKMSSTARKGASFEVGGEEDDTLDSLSSAGSPLVNDSGLHLTGLTRIRTMPARSPSSNYPMTLEIPSAGRSHAGPSAPPTPGLGISSVSLEDVPRFSRESLHSFSFANLSEEYMQTRSSVLKRSMDFMRGRLGWAAGGLGVVNAQAKVSGDEEVQGMVALLERAHAFEQEGEGLGIVPGPLTGPVLMMGENPFEKSFASQADESRRGGEGESKPVAEDMPTPTQESYDRPRPLLHIDSLPAPPGGASSTRQRAVLKRTYTDTQSLSLQNKLTDALAQPYLANEQLPRPSRQSSFSAAKDSSLFPIFTPYAHGSRGGPVTQAIFTTSGAEPWTIMAANDMACLTLGIQRAELKKISILELIREDKKNWIGVKLRGQKTTKSPPLSRATSDPSSSSSSSGSATMTGSMGGGITARLLSKPSSRETGQGRRKGSSSSSPRSASASGSGGASSPAMPKSPPKSPAPTTPATTTFKTRGVILCGDVLPIVKRDGAAGSASFWVQENRGGLIWVVEEIAEDVAFVGIDEVGCVTKATGSVEPIWGLERVRRGMDITRLLPAIPRLKGTNTGALDYDDISQLKTFTARTANDISVPVTVDLVSGHMDPTFRVSSFPHIAGMLVLSRSNYTVTSANAVVCEALFGRVPNGLPMTDLIPDFDRMLELLIEDDEVQLVEGMVVPEQSFRRARALLALKEGRTDAAAVFLRPNGVPALHRDGKEIMVDVQMRVLKSESLDQTLTADRIPEADEFERFPMSEMVYALWVTYSRTLHAANHGVGPISPLISRPGTPPRQPPPSQALSHTSPHAEDSDTSSADEASKKSTDDKKIPSVSSKSTLSTLSDVEPSPRSSTDTAVAPPLASSKVKKSIADFAILEDMGSGAYGQVKLARPKEPPNAPKVVIKYVVKKRILVDTWTRDRRLGTVPLEIHVLDYLRRCPHPNIVQMCAFFEDDVNYYIEMVPHGLPGMDLFDYIELRRSMPEEEVRAIFAQVASAVEWLHVKARVVHRDIKDENVILDGEGKIKLIDFGSANYIKNGPFDVFVGTIDYAAPEILTGNSYAGPAQDIWALGILLYTIIYKENPFYSIDEILDRDLRVPFVLSEGSIALVRAMLDREVGRRVDIGGVVGDAWVLGEA